MRLLGALFVVLFAVLAQASQDQSTEGITRFLERRLPSHVDDFTFSLTDPVRTSDKWINDEYAVSTDSDGKIHIEGNSLSGILQGYIQSFPVECSGLHRQSAPISG